MNSRARKIGTQQERTDLARAKLLKATIRIFAERGLHTVTLAEVERRAGLNRGLGAYHFKSGPALAAAAADQLVSDKMAVVETGLQPLLNWMSTRVSAAVARQPTELASVRLATAEGLPRPLSAAQRRYWTTRAAFVQANLVRGQVLAEIRDDLDPRETAQLLLGQLHGEILRIVTTRAGASPLFLAFVVRELAIAAPARRARPRKAGAGKLEQPRLFE